MSREDFMSVTYFPKMTNYVLENTTYLVENTTFLLENTTDLLENTLCYEYNLSHDHDKIM